MAQGRVISLPFPQVAAFNATFQASMAAGVSTGIILPAGAIILPSSCVVVATAFNAVTTNVLTFGTTTTATELFGAADVDEATVNKANPIVATNCLVLAAETTVYWKYTQTGAVATAGSAWLFLHFIGNPGVLN